MLCPGFHSSAVEGYSPARCFFASGNGGEGTADVGVELKRVPEQLKRETISILSNVICHQDSHASCQELKQRKAKRVSTVCRKARSGSEIIIE